MLHQVNLALAVASTSMVPTKMRGKLGGLYNTAESLGRFLGPAGFSVTYAWSISSSAFEWVDYHFVFYFSAFVLFGVAVLGWRTLTLEKLMSSSEREDAAPVPVTILGRRKEVDASFISISRTETNNMV